ncbi:deleted in malignant brain tumors 1 protein-like isoform X1 [Dreissena polymorpha]|uniref:deleted in malignant brain tumors 1 protein-like isoform X1 n=2 Tax=Dreissena polymorpha TaxID=45954 RepID=UPI0022649D9A|nr:deleted in malignant brain tumors 1 protein-like isoform X1 [Dreissena polymorpha]
MWIPLKICVISWKVEWLLISVFLFINLELSAPAAAQLPYEIRLVNGSDPSRGRVEARLQGSQNPWGTVCNDQYEVDNKAATVVCRQLGYIWGEAMLGGEFGFGPENQPIHVDQLMCNGTEAKLYECRQNPWKVHNCYHHEDVGAICYNTTVRLLSTTKQSGVGVVQTASRYNWVDACDTGWDDTAATVVCRELGFVTGIAECCSALGPYQFVEVGQTAKIYDIESFNYTCTGKERRLIECANTSFTGTCEYSHRAAVVCHNVTLDQVSKEFSVRLTNGSDYWGKVEVRHSGVWGQVCNDKWAETAANVTCRALGKGFIGGIGLGPVNTIKWNDVIKDMPVWLVDPVCNGSEPSLAQCVFTQWGEPLTSGCYPAYVLCYRKSGVQLDIVNGTTPNVGRVQIKYDGVPGSICVNEWTANDARLVCRMKGFPDGEVLSQGVTSTVDAPYYLNNLICIRDPKDIFMCSSTGWQVGTQNCPGSAQVMCYKNVRLIKGKDDSAGIALYYDNETSSWMGFCDLGFKPKYAELICMELGYQTGSVLPSGAFLRHYMPLGRPNIACGNETSIIDCPWDGQSCMKSDNHYVSISCHEDIVETEPQYKMLLKVPDGTYGQVYVRLYNTWGEICADNWGDTEADVFCRSQRFKGGLADFYSYTAYQPTLVYEIECKGNESDLKECIIGKYHTCSDSGNRAGVICYRQTAPTVSLVEGHVNYGRVQVSIDGIAGPVCDWGWNNNAASVVCKQLGRNFTGGEVFRDFPVSTQDPILQIRSCNGLEDSLFKCKNNGWMTVDNVCANHAQDVGVYCYGKVRVISSKKSPTVLTGRVEVLPPPGSRDGSDWVAICGDGFDQTDAEVVCLEMGFDAARVIAPGSFGATPSWKFYTNMACTKGGRDVHADCKYSKGLCKMESHNYASVQCFMAGTDLGTRYYIENGYHGKVIVEELGQNGSVCIDGWDDHDATVLCRSKGFIGGVVLGVPEIYTHVVPILFTNVTCLGPESSLDECTKSRKVPVTCSISRKVAGVLCYRSTGVKVKLVNNQMANYFGRVEIEYDGQSGTVCDNHWSTYDARVICRQLGFPDGEAYMKAYFGAGDGSIYLSGLMCDSLESSLLECPNTGWTVRDVMCAGHENDAGVRCTRNVLTEQADNYGAVKVWKKGSFYHVCADDFDDADATVVCRTMGYPYGKSLCCDAFGHQTTAILYSKSTCTGNEVNYNNCVKVEGAGLCLSNQYASVVCSKEQPLPGIDVGIEEYTNSTGSGPVVVSVMGQNGYMCAENFDDRDAMVICRQLGYLGGYAFKYYNDDVKLRSTMDLRWLRGPNCTGSETRLEQCPGINVGNVSGCFVLSHAAVFCYRNQDTSDFSVRLSNAAHPGEGFVEVKVNGTWGSVCMHRTLISNFEATVICQQLKFKYGVYIPFPSYTPLTGKVWLSNVNCVGTEKSVRECLLSGMGGEISAPCFTHKFDMAVKCYSHVRLSASPVPNFGMLQILNVTSNRWVSVCDTGFDDVAAGVVCRDLGYKDGKAQCCSSLGPKLTFYNPIEVAGVRCNGSETDFMSCQMQFNATCPSGNYVTVLCSETVPPLENFTVALTDREHFGNVEVSRYGLQGAVCDIGWDDNDAKVLCRELGYTTGFATNGTNTAERPMILAKVDCAGTEKRLADCGFSELISGHNCSSRLTRAAVFCSMTTDNISYRLGGSSQRTDRGRAEVYVNGRWGTICDLYWEDRDADVFCKSAGFLGGEVTVLVASGDPAQPIWMSHVECTGTETDLRQCRASWDIKTVSRCSHFDDAGVKCYRSARLNRGDYTTAQTNGIVEVFVQQSDPYANPWFTVCADTFTDNEAEVVCRVLGHDHGIAVCCSPYGYNTSPMSVYRPQCHGNETQMTQCALVINSTLCSRQNYASVTCYNRTTSTAYSLALKGSLVYTGQVVLYYLGVAGRICWTGWDDADARVVCRELGFMNGSAYFHYKSSFIYLNYNGPYWTSDLNCTGEESKIQDCPHRGFGNVTSCHDSGNYAGVICYNDQDVAYRIAGGNARFGRVEFMQDGTWHTICSNTWGEEEANVTCRQLGYVTGNTYTGDLDPAPSGKAYTINFRCAGNEHSLSECPHEGIQESTFCQDHKKDDGVFCYTSVKLSGPDAVNSDNGSVMYYLNDTWSLICNDGFNDQSARRVCQELGFVDGRAICCSAYGSISMFDLTMSNYTLTCDDPDAPLENCLKPVNGCQTGYASAVCFHNNTLPVEYLKYEFNLEKSNGNYGGHVKVTHLGVTGSVCSQDWDDNDASILCRSKGFKNGLAYQHSENNVLVDQRGPYWAGGFNCTGNEIQLKDCPFLNRTNLQNCSSYDIAAVLCFNESGIQYRMVSNSSHYGRVEMQVGGIWGTVCDQYWDKREAAVFCRQLNFTDGEPVGGAHFGAGSGPIWISHLECKGTEKYLHQCPHRGFTNEISSDWWFPLPCETHSDDAGVFCYKSVRLNSGPSADAGGLEVHRDGKWYGVCDSGIGKNEALVVCKSLKSYYVDAVPVNGSSYGNLSGEIGFSSIKCSGQETDLNLCQLTFEKSCDSGHYASVYCSNSTIVDTSFKVRLAGDSLSSSIHGILEARVEGIWGRVCLHGFTDSDARVACRQFGYDGGVAYLHIMKNDKPVLVSNVQCTGTENSISECPKDIASPNREYCNYGSNDAGVICYNRTDGIGFDYRLNGGSNPSNGRVEIGYAGRWGMVCAWSWQSNDAAVLCRALGYKDGIVSYEKNISLGFTLPWVTGFFCQGHETSLMTCLNTGFNSTFLTDLCMGGRDPGAYSQCFNETVEDTKVRLVDGPNNHSGRVEVFMTGANQWGTICDDYWDDPDAIVVCRQLGFYGGQALKKAPYGQGTGPIWFDNLKCIGNESKIGDCGHRGIGTHNCNHTEDVGVICDLMPPSTVPPGTIITPSLTTQPVTPGPSSDPPTTPEKPTLVTEFTRIPVTTGAPVTTTAATTKSVTTKQPDTPMPPVTTSAPLTTEAATKVSTSVIPPSTMGPTPKPTEQDLPTTSPSPETTTNAKSNHSVAASVTNTSKANLGVAVAVPIVVILVVVAIIACVVMRLRRGGKRQGYSRETLDDSVIHREPDGSVSASNQMYGLDLKVSSPGATSDISSPGEDNMMLGSNGRAFYSKGVTNGDSPGAFRNPLYEARNHDSDGQFVGQSNGATHSLPANGEISFPDRDPLGIDRHTDA